MPKRPGKPKEPSPKAVAHLPLSKELSSVLNRPIPQTSAESDAQLIRAYLNGNAEAFADLVRRYQDRLFNTLCRYLNDEEDALDVVQETFLSASQALRRFQFSSQFYTWLYRIALNHSIDLRRRKVRASLVKSDSGLEQVADLSPQSRPESNLERKEAVELVQDALMCLSGEHRLVLVLKDIDELQYEEIADVIGIPIGTVRSRLHRARLELREVLTRLAPALNAVAVQQMQGESK